MTTISTPAFYARAGQDLASLRGRAADLQGQIASGQRLTSGSDDPVAASHLRSLARADTLAAADTAGAAQASADLSLADGALTEMTAQVQRLRELASQAANGTLNPGQRAAIGREVADITDQLFQLANSRDSMGHALFGGTTSGQAYVLDASGIPVYAGSASAGSFDLGGGQTVVRGITGPEFLNFGGTDLLNVAKALGEALQGAVADPAQAARDALSTLDQGLDTIGTAQTVLGARLNWIDQTTARATRLSEVRAQDEADTGGTDMAGTITQLQQVMTVLEASQASFAKFSALSLFDLIRG